MKKQLILILVATLLLGVNVSCDKDNIIDSPPKKTFYKSYIDAFIKCDSLDFRCIDGVTIDKANKICHKVADYKSQENIAIGVYGTKPSKSMKIFTDLYYSKEWKGKYDNIPVGFDPNKAYFDSINTQYDKYIKVVGDTAYNKEYWYSKRNVVVTLSALKKVVITTDKNFGDNYPAGTDLSPLFYIAIDDTYATVKSGYKAAPDAYRYFPDNYDDNDLALFPMSVRCLKLLEANLEEYPFTEAIWELFLDAKPEKTDSYTFHVKFTFADGTVLEGDAPAITVKGVE